MASCPTNFLLNTSTFASSWSSWKQGTYMYLICILYVSHMYHSAIHSSENVLLNRMRFRDWNGPSVSSSDHSWLTGTFLDPQARQLTKRRGWPVAWRPKAEENPNVLFHWQPSGWLNLLGHVKLHQGSREHQKCPIPNQILATCIDCLVLKAGLKDKSAKLKPLFFRSYPDDINKCFSKILAIKLRYTS